MGIFDTIRNAILGGSDKPKTAEPAAAPVKASASTVSGIVPQPRPAEAEKPPAAVVDVESVLDAAVKRKRQKLNWRTSIIDLMKALDLDSSLANRKKLAKELGYGEDMKNSARMNRWLHSQVMQKLADIGGTVPPELH
jgi:hypothetical protein